MLKIGVLGCGRIGQMHAANIAQHPNADLAMVFDIFQPNAEMTALRHDVSIASTASDVFQSSEVDAVLVATTTDTHADFIEMAVAARKPVLCEKPIDLSLTRVSECAARIAGTDVPVQLGFNRRFDPGHRSARNAVLNGDIGDLHQVIITSRDPEMPPRSYYETAGGLLRDMTIHDFDLARFMLDDEPVEVFAVGGGLIDPAMMKDLKDLDTAMIIMRTADGKQCHINNSRAAGYGYDQRVELLGTKGMVQSENKKENEVRKFSSKQTETSAPYLNFFIERYKEAFDAEVDAFVTSITTGTKPEVGFEDGWRALILAEAAYLSISQKRIVRVDEVG